MEMTEEALLAELFPAEDAILKESWPVPTADIVKEFEDFLEDIGVRA